MTRLLLWGLVAVLFVPGAWAAPDCVEVLPRTLVSGGTNGVSAIHAADIDRDGLVDVVSASANDNKINWYRNDGGDPPSFTEFTISNRIDGASDVFIADIDDDDNNDVVVTSANGNSVSWFENLGDIGVFPTFIQRTVATGVNDPASVHAADVDDDGDLDVLVAARGDNSVFIFESNLKDPGEQGALAFTPRVVDVDAPGVRSVFAANIDGDTDDVPEILSASFLDDSISWYRPVVPGEFGQLCDDLETPCEENGDCETCDENDENCEPIGDGLCAARIDKFVISSSSDGASSVFAIDLDQDTDGDVDVLSASALDDEIAWYEAEITTGVGPPTVSFTKRILTNVADGATAVFAADLDDDADMDVLYASRFDNTIAWFENEGGTPPTLTQRHVLSSDAPGSNSVLAIQLDDGDTDFDVVSAGSVFGTVATGDRIRWWDNSDATPGTFTERTVSAGAIAPTALLAADVDEAGGTDLIAASSTDDKIAWFENDGLDPPGFTERIITLDARQTNALHLADLNGDDKDDILSAEAGGDPRIGWYENLGFVCDDLTTMCAGDGDCGGIGDETCTVRYEPRVVSSNVEGPTSVFAIDLDQDKDADLDVLSASEDDDKIVWYENLGGTPPSFTAYVISTDADGAASVFAVDLDQDLDGDIDVLSASTEDDKIAWYENLGGSPPDWEEHVISSSANGAIQVLAADVDDDGDPDVISASSNDDRVVWYENQGFRCDNDPETACTDPVIDCPAPEEGEPAATCELRFLANTISASSDFLRGILAVDLDGDDDGDVDVVAVSSGDDEVSWFENLGRLCVDLVTSCDEDADCEDVDGEDLRPCSNIRWERHLITADAESARAVAAIDIDDDDALDIATGSFFEINWHRGDSEDVCTGFDANGDMRIDGVEVIWLGMAFGDSCEDPDDPTAEWWFPVDANGDCFIDGIDLSILTSTGVWATFVEGDPEEVTLCAFSCQ